MEDLHRLSPILYVLLFIFIYTLALDWTYNESIMSTQDNGYVPRKVENIKRNTIKSIVYEVDGTFYNATVDQCDQQPLMTASMELISIPKLESGELRWVALSRDLFKKNGGSFNFGDTIYVYHSNPKLKGLWVVKDCMHKRCKKMLDFLSADPHFLSGPVHNILISKNKFYRGRND